MLKIIPVGGICFHAYDDGEFLGSMEFGSIDADGEYQECDDEVIDEAREMFGFARDYPAEIG